MPGRPFDPKLPQRVIEAFFAERHAPGERFWTVREIAQRFGVSRYAADIAVRELLRKSLLAGHGHTGTFVAESSAAPQREGKPHVALALPFWQPPMDLNPWHEAIRGRIEANCRQHGWRTTTSSLLGQQDGATFPAQFAAAQCSCAIVLSPPPSEIPTLARVRAQRIPVVSIGHVPTGGEKLGIPVVDGDDREAIRLLVLQLRARGMKRIVMAGLSDPQIGTDRIRGFVDALEQYDHAYPEDMVIESLDLNYVMASLRRRMAGARSPQAVIFQNHLVLRAAMREIPALPLAIKERLVAVVIDEFGVRRLWPDLRFVDVMLDPVTVADTAVAVLTNLLRHEAVRPLTLLKYQISWP